MAPQVKLHYHEMFYGKFDCQIHFGRDGRKDKTKITENVVMDGIKGELPIAGTGIYYLYVTLRDTMGTETFRPVAITANNRLPEGKLPEAQSCTIFTKTREYRLSDYFSDPDGDEESGSGNRS